MAIFIGTVATSADDAQETEANSSFNSTVALIKAVSNTFSSSFRFMTGMRFDNVPIPHGAVILSATIDIDIPSATFDDANLNIHCEDADDAVDFSSNADLFNRARTTASVAWVADGVGTGVVTSPGFIAPVQEVINRAARLSGQAIMVIFKPNADVNKSLQYGAEDDATLAPAQLTITYSIARLRRRREGM